MIESFIHGIILALALILPPGPQNLFIFLQGINQSKFIHSFPVLITASLADTILILVAIFGVSTIVLTLPSIKILLILGGILFLIYMGWLSWNSNHFKNSQFNEIEHWSLKKKIFFTLSVSLLNPHAILDTIGVIGTSSLSYTGNIKASFAIACILVSWVWFTFLIIAGTLMSKFSYFIPLFNKISAVIMWMSAIYLIKNLLIV